jgi:hypothetical protein
LFQVKYTLSVAYKASLVLIEAEVSPQTALPVRARGVYAVPFRQPTIEKICAKDGEESPIRSDSKVIVSGRQLKGAINKVRIGEVEVTISPTDTENTVSDAKVELSLGSTLFSGMPLRAGVQGLQVLHPVMMGVPEVEHYGFESNVKPFVLSPAVTIESVSSTELTLSFTPNVGRSQRVMVLLNELNPPSGNPNGYAIKAPPDNGITDPNVTETDSITFSVAEVKSGAYLLRVQVDGAQSPVEAGSDPGDPNKYSDPKVQIP